MVCPAVLSGQKFLASALAHLDCQAQSIGAYGFEALADPSSTVALSLSGLLTIFIALFGIRLLLGYPTAGRDVVGDVLRVGIALTLATSWPAWRVIGYDLVIDGPQEIARDIGLAAGLPGTSGFFADHLQRVDEGLAALNTYGSGRLGVAQGDWFQLGFARSAYLLGTLGPLALVKLTTGILLALTPLIAGLLLFGVSRPIFAGWLRGLVTVFLASIALSIILGAELALIEPWLKDALEQRVAEQQLLDAPIEILVLTLAFTLVSVGAIATMARIAFLPASPGSILSQVTGLTRQHFASSRESSEASTFFSSEADNRSRSVALAITENLRREERMLEALRGLTAAHQGQPATAGLATGASSRLAADQALGNSYRRNRRRASGLGQARDRTQ